MLIHKNILFLLLLIMIDSSISSMERIELPSSIEVIIKNTAQKKKAFVVSTPVAQLSNTLKNCIESNQLKTPIKIALQRPTSFDAFQAFISLGTRIKTNRLDSSEKDSEYIDAEIISLKRMINYYESSVIADLASLCGYLDIPLLETHTLDMLIHKINENPTNLLTIDPDVYPERSNLLDAVLEKILNTYDLNRTVQTCYKLKGNIGQKIEYPQRDGLASSITWTHKSNILVSSFLDGSVFLQKPKRQQYWWFKHPLSKHAHITCCIDKNDQYLACAGDEKISLLNLNNMAEKLRIIELPEAPLYGITFRTHNEKTELLIAFKTELHTWDLNSSETKLLHTFNKLPENVICHGFNKKHIFFIADQSVKSSSSDETLYAYLYTWDTTGITRKKIKTPSDVFFNTKVIGCNLKHKTVLTTAPANKEKINGLFTYQLESLSSKGLPITVNTHFTIKQIYINRQGSRIVCPCIDARIENTTVPVDLLAFNTKTNETMELSNNSLGQIKAVAWHKDGTKFACLNQSGTIMVFSLNNKTLTKISKSIRSIPVITGIISLSQQIEQGNNSNSFYEKELPGWWLKQNPLIFFAIMKLEPALKTILNAPISRWAYWRQYCRYLWMYKKSLLYLASGTCFSVLAISAWYLRYKKNR